MVPCTGRVDPVHLLKAIEGGIDGIYVAGCLEGDCHFISGNLKAKKKVAYVRNLLEDCGFEKDRIMMFNISASDGPEFARAAQLMTEKIKELGPNPLGGCRRRLSDN